MAQLDADEGPTGENTLSVARQLAMQVALVPSDGENLKVTTTTDLDAAAAILDRRA